MRANLDGVEVAPFGSFASGVHSIGSDIDISLEVSPHSKWAYSPADATAQPTPPGLRGKQGAKSLRRLRDAELAARKKAKVRVLQRMVNVLLRAGMRQVQLIPRANVPLIKFVEPHSGVQVRAVPVPVPTCCSPSDTPAPPCENRVRASWRSGGASADPIIEQQPPWAQARDFSHPVFGAFGRRSDGSWVREGGVSMGGSG